MFSDADVIDAIKEHCLVLSSPRMLPRGHIALHTKLLYPDGGSIAVYIERGHLIRPAGLALSDFGNSLAKLAEYQVNPWVPKSRIRAIEESVGDLGVKLLDDRLVLEIAALNRLGDGVITLAQACVRTSCMVFNRRATQRRTLAEEVKGIVDSLKLPVIPKFRYTGPASAPVVVDYRVTNPSKSSAVLTLTGGHVQAIEVFRKWSDLEHLKVEDRFVTIFDERREFERKEDLDRLQRISEVVSVNNRLGVEMLLRKAA